jgi:hypothetical protein
VLCSCFTYLRRKFNDALLKTAKQESKALEGLRFCQKLFALEERWTNLTSEERLVQQLEHSKPVLDAFLAWLDKVNVLNGSRLAETVTYARNQCEPLSVYLFNGRIDISTSKVENTIRLLKLAVTMRLILL